MDFRNKIKVIVYFINITNLCNRIFKGSLFAELLLLALTVMFGLQILRMLLAGFPWILGDRFGLGAVELGGIALILFSTAFLAGKLCRILGNRWALIITVGGLGLLRLTMQFSWEEPLANLVLAMLATVFFVLFLPIYLDKMRSSGKDNTSIFAFGLLIGVMLDTAIFGFYSTYDMIWRSDILTLLLTLVLVLIQWFLLYISRTNTNRTNNSDTGSNTKINSLSWIAIGPFFFLQLILFQNIARLTALTNWPLPLTFGWILISQLLAFIVIIWFLRNGVRNIWPQILTFGIILLVISAFPNPQGAWFAAFVQLAGQVSISLLIVFIIVNRGNIVSDTNPPSSIVPNGSGMVLFTVLILGYYAVYQINLPYVNTILEPIAASIIALCAIVASIKSHQDIKVNIKIRLVLGVATILMILPLVSVLTWNEVETTSGDGFPVQIMTYNLHNGFNTDGYLDLESLAKIIEDNNPDIVALQEISRGWVISGGVDMLSWLSQRLNMPYIFGPTADPLWGNAILSRYPIQSSESYELPPRDLFILRGFTATVFDIDKDVQLEVVATHFHHLDDGSRIRQLQSETIVDFWNQNNLTVILGDFNAEPDTPEIEILRKAGLIDSLIGEVTSTNYTFHSTNLYQRIDYIWLSPDLNILEVDTPFTSASDHLPVFATINN